MKLASVSFNFLESQIGGAHVPAEAFKHWCDELEIECDLVDYKMGMDFSEYTGVFFCTPPTRFITDSLTVPYVAMIHAEFDSYSLEAMEGAEAVVVIGENFWKFPNEIFWYPCTDPKFLLTGDEVFDQERKGTIYASRLTTWKSANVLSAFSILDAFDEKFGPVHMWGKANDPKFEYAIKCIDSPSIIYDQLYNRHSISEECAKREFYWDVFGKRHHNITMNRLNLSCFEAMKEGCIPIVNMDNVPDEVKPFCIDHKKMLSEDYDVPAMRKNMVELAKSKSFGYHQVKEQVLKIIEVLR